MFVWTAKLTEQSKINMVTLFSENQDFYTASVW